ncbi:Formamidopyrimidine-DNA glycosylase [uncultured virus]|nr:Formamidopyrimidine-DNA glycosylase [uncultured virus]
MPEVVEVFFTAIYLNNKLKNKQIREINILKGRYTKQHLNGLSSFKKNLPLKIKKIQSKGKFLWFELSGKNGNYYILNTLGMTGEWGFQKNENSNISFNIEDPNSNKVKLYFTDYRNFGTVILTKNVKKLEAKKNKLAPDFLTDSFDNEEFYQRIKNFITKKNEINQIKANKNIVSVLMDQTALGSGIGSYLAQEQLFKAKISPHKKLIEFYNDKKLSDQLAYSIKYIIKLAYLTATIGYMEHLNPNMKNFIERFRAKIKNNPKNKYNFHPEIDINNDVFSFKIYRQKLDPIGNKVLTDKTLVKGRTIYYSPLQK